MHTIHRTSCFMLRTFVVAPRCISNGKVVQQPICRQIAVDAPKLPAALAPTQMSRIRASASRTPWQICAPLRSVVGESCRQPSSTALAPSWILSSALTMTRRVRAVVFDSLPVRCNLTAAVSVVDAKQCRALNLYLWWVPAAGAW